MPFSVPITLKMENLWKTQRSDKRHRYMYVIMLLCVPTYYMCTGHCSYGGLSNLSKSILRLRTEIPCVPCADLPFLIILFEVTQSLVFRHFSTFLFSQWRKKKKKEMSHEDFYTSDAILQNVLNHPIFISKPVFLT